MNKKEWREYWKGKYNPPLEVIVSTTKGNKTFTESFLGDEWIKGRQIRVYDGSSLGALDPRVFPRIVKGIKHMIRTVGLNFNVRFFGLEDYIRKAIAAAHTPLELEIERFSGHLLRSFPERSHGCVVATDSFIYSNENLKNNEIYISKLIGLLGFANFSGGYSLISADFSRSISHEGTEYSREPVKGINLWPYLTIIENIARHETGHLLGLGPHHEIENGVSPKHVTGYGGKNITDTCVMSDGGRLVRNRYLSSVCPACLDALIYFWKGIEEKTGQRFLKGGLA